jgi:uncharacterized protein YdaU (DUF1376 family)
MCRQWIDGDIPDDQNMLARLCRIDKSAMAEAWGTLSNFFPVLESGKRANRFMWIERAKVVADLEKRSDEGTKAARKRWDDARNKPDAKPNGSPMPDPMQEQSRAEKSRAETTLAQMQFARLPGVPSEDRKSLKPTEAQIEKLYELYPRKRGKINAKKAIRKAASQVMAGDSDHPALPLDDALDYLAQRVTLYAKSVRGQESDYIPYPATWFNSGSFWDDEREWSKHRSNISNPNMNGAPIGNALDYHRELLEESAQ